MSEIERLPITARINIVLLADLAAYLDENGVRPKTRSDLINKVVQMLHAALADADRFNIRTSSMHEAKKVLDRFGLGFRESTNAHKELVKGLQVESQQNTKQERELSEAAKQALAELQSGDMD